jgi:hypothetical protein
VADVSGTPRTLEEAVRAEVAAGVLDPAEVLARISERYGQTKLLTWIVAVVARIAAGGASVSHSASVSGGRSSSRAPGVVSGKTERGLRVRKAAGDVSDDFFASARWVSAVVGWKRIADLTADDCRVIAAQYELLANRADEHRRWFVDAAVAIEAEHVATVGEIERELAPPSELTATQAKMLSARAGHERHDAQTRNAGAP